MGISGAKIELDLLVTICRNLYDIVITLFPGLHGSGNITQVCITFRCTDFEKLFDTRQTLRDVVGCSRTTAMEGTERQLGSRFTDTLCGNDADRMMVRYQVSGSRIDSVRFLRYAEDAGSTQYGHDLDAIDGFISLNRFSDSLGNELAALQMALDVLSGKTAHEA